MGTASPEKFRSSLIEAAALLIQEGRTATLSLDLLADATGLEMEAVKEQFPSLEALMEAIVTGMVGHFRERINAELGTDETPGAWHRAYIRASLPARDERLPDIAGAVLASAPLRHSYLSAVRDAQEDFKFAREGDGVDVATSTLICMALDGIWLNRMFAMDWISRGHEDAMIAHLLSLVPE